MDSNKQKISSTDNRKSKLPKTPFNNIAVSLSGGGFRAAGFHLGVITYLSSQSIYKTSLLEHTRILSTSSAGTFVGVKYTASIKRGESLTNFYKQVYEFIGNGDLVEKALAYLSDDDNWTNGRQRSLINAFASVYHDEFESASFGLLWQNEFPLHIKEINFNATEFNFALPFRFFKTEREDADNNPEFIGNNKIHIPIEMAKEIRLADIIAASSCFPFGFEPMNFPDDFIHEESINLRKRELLPQNVYDGDSIDYPIGLMDGGIDDNQGVDAVVMSEERMKNYKNTSREFRSDDTKSVDLFIISDASIPKMESYRSTTEKKGMFGKLNFNVLRNIGILSAGIGSMLIIFGAYAESRAGIIFLTIFGTGGLILALVLLLLSFGFTGMAKLLGVPEFFTRRMAIFDKLRFGVLYNLIGNRRKSSMKLVSKVFIKQMRWHSFQRVFGDSDWRPRMIMNGLFDITGDEVQKRKNKYPHFSKDILEPGEAMISVADKANSMATTLWFTKKELEGKENMLNTVIACGQFNICFNLLEYFEKFILNSKYADDYEKYSPEIRQSLTDLHFRLVNDWNKFKEDPYWMIKKWNQESGIHPPS